MQFPTSSLRGLGDKADNNSYTPTYTEGGQVYNAALPAGGLGPTPQPAATTLEPFPRPVLIAGTLLVAWLMLAIAQKLDEKT